MTKGASPLPEKIIRGSGLTSEKSPVSTSFWLQAENNASATIKVTLDKTCRKRIAIIFSRRA
jgi:hypothetical protein